LYLSVAFVLFLFPHSPPSRLCIFTPRCFAPSALALRIQFSWPQFRTRFPMFISAVFPRAASGRVSRRRGLSSPSDLIFSKPMKIPVFPRVCLLCTKPIALSYSRSSLPGSPVRHSQNLGFSFFSPQNRPFLACFPRPPHGSPRNPPSANPKKAGLAFRLWHTPIRLPLPICRLIPGVDTAHCKLRVRLFHVY